MTSDLVISNLETARNALALAQTIQQKKGVLDIAQAAKVFAKRQKLGEEIERQATAIIVEAKKQIGQELVSTPRNTGTKADGRNIGGTVMLPPSEIPTLEELGITKRESAEAQRIYQMSVDEPEIFVRVQSGELTANKAWTETKRKAVKQNLDNIEVQEVKATAGVFDVIVIDPPWPMEKIERDVAPNQVAFEYPTMSLDEIADISIPSADNCHLFLWTTQKFLPSAFELLDKWGMKYVLTFVWHKNGGFQPFNLPQYNCEFALYARKGTPQFVDFKDFMTCFNAKRGAHSEKPEEFYELLRRVTAGRRLDMFNRRTIEGFYGWGNEAK